MNDESIDCYVAGKQSINIDGTIYEAGSLIPTMGQAANRVIKSLIDNDRIRRVVVVTPAQLKRLQKAATVQP